MEDPQVAGHDVAVIGGALHLPASRLWAQTGDVLYVKMEALHVACDAVYFDNPHDENGRSIGAGKKLDQSLFNQLVFHWHSSTYTEKLPKDCSGGPDTQIFYKIQVSIKGKPVTADILDTYGDGSIPDGSYYRVGGDVYHDNGGGTQRVSEPPLSAVLDSFKDAEKAHPEK